MEVAFTIGLILNVISMIACPIIAGNKGRSVAGWFFGGLFLSVIELIIVSCLREIPDRRSWRKNCSRCRIQLLKIDF